MSEKIEIDVNIAEEIESRLEKVVSQASYFEEKYPEDDSLVKVFEDVKGVISEFNKSTLNNKLSSVEIGKDFYNRIDDEYGKGMFNIELVEWASSVLPENDNDLHDIRFFDSASRAKHALGNIIAKLKITEK